MALKLIGAVGVKVRPEAEDFRDEAERQIKRQLGGRKAGLPLDVDPEIDTAKLRKEFAAAKKRLQDELKRTSKPVEFTTDIRFDQAAWDKAKQHLKRTEADIRQEMESTRKKLGELDGQRKQSIKLARELALEHKKLSARAMRGTASGNDVARVKGQYDLVRESLRQTTSQIDELNDRLRQSNDDMVEWARNSGNYSKDLGAAVEAHEELIRKTADAHRSYMAKVREDSNDLLGGLKYGIRKNVEDIKKAFESVNGDNSFGIDIDTERFRSELDKVKRLFHRARDDMDDTEVDIKPVLDESAHRIAWVRLKALARDRIAMIHVKVNGASARLAQNTLKSIYGMSGARTGVDFIKDFGRYMRDLDKHIPALGMIGTAAVGAVGGVTALVGSVGHLANELVRMSGAALALPGILGGFAVGIGAMVAVMKDFNREVPQISQDLGKLQDKMSNNFWNQARVPIMDAWNKAFPHFSRGIQETSTALGKWTSAMAGAFSTHFDMSAFDKMFGNLNKSIDIAALSADDLMKSMSILGQTGSEYLPRLALWANDVAAGFRNWLEEAERTGELNQIIDTGIQKLKEFGVILREAGELTYILGSAAERAGFSGFGEMANGMERFNESLKSAEGQDVLDDLFQGAAKIADGFKRALGAVGDFVWNSSDMLNELSGIVGDLIGDTFEKLFKAFERPAFQDGLTNFFQGFSDGLNSITDQAPVIADLLGAIGDVAGEVAENLGGVIGQLLESFGPEITGALEEISPAVDKLGEALENVIKAADAIGLDDLIADIIELAGAGIEKVAGDLNALALSLEAVAAFKAGDFEGLDEVKKRMKDDLDEKTDEKGVTRGSALPGFGWTEDIGSWVADTIMEIGGWIARLNIGIWDAISSVDWGGMWDGAIDGISSAWNNFVSWLQDLFNFDGAFVIDDWWPSIQEWWDEQITELQDIFDTAKEWVQEVWDGFWDWLTGLFSGGGDADTTAPGDGGDGGMAASIIDGLGLDGLGDQLGEKFEEAKTWVLEKWEDFTGWLGGLFGGGEEGGGFQFNLDFIMNAIDWASDKIGNVVNTAREWVGDKWEGVLSALDNARTTISRVKDQALNWARGKYQGVLTALDNARTTISRVKDQALNWARGKYRGVLTALDNARGTISSVKNKALDYARGKYEGVLRALDRASSIVSSVQRKINSLKGKTVSIVTNVIRKVKNMFADGGLTNGQGVQYFADGGVRRENHVAQIAPAGAMRVWAEPETGGEAYIPLALSKRTRSEQILASVADKFGMSVQKFADGSDPSGSGRIQTAVGDTYNINVESVPTDNTEETTSAIMFNLKHMKRGGGAVAFA